MSHSCVFCRIVAGEVPSVKVAEDETTFAFMDINPALDDHLLVVPKQHSTDVTDITSGDLLAVTLVAQRIARVTAEALGADGVNLLNCSGRAAGQTVFHFHLHVIPRYADTSRDRLRLPWEPGVAGEVGKIAALGARIGAAL